MQSAATTQRHPVRLSRASAIQRASQLVSHCSSAQQFSQQLLDIVVEEFDPLIARITCGEDVGTAHVVHRRDGISAAQCNHFEKTVLVPLAQETIQASTPRPRVSTLAQRRGVALCGPVVSLHTGELLFTVGLIADLGGDVRDSLARLDTLISLASTLATQQDVWHSRPTDAKPAEEVCHQTEYSSTREFAVSLCNKLCNSHACEQVAVGIVKRQAVQVVAVSGFAQLKQAAPGMADIRQSMEECFDQEKPVAYPPLGKMAEFPIHRRWSQESGSSHVCSIPLRHADSVVAVLSLRRSEFRPISRQELDQLTLSVRPLGAQIDLIDKATQSLSQHVVSVGHQLMRHWRSPLRVASFFTGLVFFLWLCLATMVYRPLCDATVISADLRHVTAPFESRLIAAHVNAGDVVEAGDVLAEFETHELQLDLDSIHAEITRTEVEVRRAIENGDASSAALQKAHVDVLLARKQALERRITSAAMTAPADGMIVQSHVYQRVGQVFRQGEPVLEFAPNHGWMLDVQVPEGIAPLVELGQKGHFVSTSRPYESIEFSIEQLDGSAEVIDQSNVFVAHAVLRGSPDWMRSGIRGVARIDTIRKPVWWIAFHKAIDWARLRFWI